MKLGDCIVDKPIAFFLKDVSGYGAGDQLHSGVIGTNVFQQFTVVFDYRHKLVTFKKNTNENNPDQYEMTGFHILATGASFHTFTIDQVLTDSPAEHSGMKVGDAIETVNQLPASQLTVDDLDKLFRKPGSLSLTISRNGKKIKKKLELKPLI